MHIVHSDPCFRRDEFLVPLGISQNALARATGVPLRHIQEIVLGKRGTTAVTAVRLAAALGTTERFWLSLQADYELEEVHRLLGDLLRGSSSCDFASSMHLYV